MYYADEPEPTPSQTLLVPWNEATLRRTVSREEWIGCWKVGPGGYLELSPDGSARQKFVSRGTSCDVQGAIKWEWINPRLIHIHYTLPQSEETVAEHRVIRFDGKKMWT